MHVIIAGSRSITDYASVCDAVRRSGFAITRVVSGMAAGVDSLAIRYAAEHGLPCDRFPAEWKRWGRSAGYRRNAQMAEHADALIAVWDGKSPGTRHMIEVAKPAASNLCPESKWRKPMTNDTAAGDAFARLRADGAKMLCRFGMHAFRFFPWDYRLSRSPGDWACKHCSLPPPNGKPSGHGRGTSGAKPRTMPIT